MMEKKRLLINKSLPKVYCATVVCIECSEDVLAEVVCVAAWENLGVTFRLL